MALRKLAFLIVALVTAAALPALAQGGGGGPAASGAGGGSSAGSAASGAGGAAVGGSTNGAANSGSANGGTANGGTTGNSKINSHPPQRLLRPQARRRPRKRTEMPARALLLTDSRSDRRALASDLLNIQSIRNSKKSLIRRLTPAVLMTKPPGQFGGFSICSAWSNQSASG